jgi:hypothetical protein
MGWQIINQDSDNINILALPTEDAVAPLVDQVPFYDASAGGNRKTAVNNLFPAGSITGDKLVNGALSADTLGRSKMADQFLSFSKMASEVFPIFSAVKTDTQSFTTSAAAVVTGLTLNVTKPTSSARVVLFGWINGGGKDATVSLQVGTTDLISPVGVGSRVPGMFALGDDFGVREINCVPLFGVHTALGTSFTYRVFCRTGNSVARINVAANSDDSNSNIKVVSALYALVLP